MTKYAAYHGCLKDGARDDVLPLGVFRAPKDGWLITAKSAFITIQGCGDGISVYDLASGSTYIVGCRGTTWPGRLHVGRVPTGAIREAAWIMMLQHTSEAIRPRETVHRLPDDIPAARRAGEKSRFAPLVIETSDDTTVEWAWIRGRPGALRGALSGRFQQNDTSLTQHAYSLLHIADIAFQENAPAAKPGCSMNP